MALRMPIQQCLKATSNLTTPPVYRMFSSATTYSSRVGKTAPKRRRLDPYAVQQARARKAANLSRQEVLRQERSVQKGDPLRGIETELVRSFDDPPTIDQDGSDGVGKLNFFVSESELNEGMEKSKWLLSPSEAQSDTNRIENIRSNETPADRQEKREEEQANAAEAMRRIGNLSLGSSKDRLRLNIQRCVSIFGRHNTDAKLRNKPAAVEDTSDNSLTAMPRAGPDTGSSEVQASILTAKIRALRQVLELRGRMDKHNIRNLQVLVHKRQKHLRYLQRKEKGGPRWQNLVSKLGITDAAWKGEISLPRYIERIE